MCVLNHAIATASSPALKIGWRRWHAPHRGNRLATESRPSKTLSIMCARWSSLFAVFQLVASVSRLQRKQAGWYGRW